MQSFSSRIRAWCHQKNAFRQAKKSSDVDVRVTPFFQACGHDFLEDIVNRYHADKPVLVVNYRQGQEVVLVDYLCYVLDRGRSFDEIGALSHELAQRPVRVGNYQAPQRGYPAKLVV